MLGKTIIVSQLRIRGDDVLHAAAVIQGGFHRSGGADERFGPLIQGLQEAGLIAAPIRKAGFCQIEHPDQQLGQGGVVDEAGPFGLIQGGAQENKRRAGTENIPGIVGLARALEIQTERLAKNAEKMTALREKLIRGIFERIPDVTLNGHRTERLPNNVNFCLRYIESESVLLWLDLNGIAASSGSACTSGSLDPSHVLLAMGISHEAANGSLRLTLSELTTEAEIDYVLETLPPIVQRLRDMSPIYPKGA